MSKRVLTILLAFLTFVFFFSAYPVFARTLNYERSHFPPPDRVPDFQIPQRNGIYDVPGFPGFKVRVFVHDARPKPTPSPSPSPATCSVSDPDSNAVVDSAGWHLPSSWTYNLNPYTLPRGISSTNLSTITNDAFSRWSSAIVGKVTFSKGQDTITNRARYDGKNLIAWGTAPSSALAVTYTWYYVNTGEVAEVDTIMNQRFSWSWTPYSSTACVNTKSYDAQDILTHEFGHWMGLDDEYTPDYIDNTMYGYGSKAEIKKDTLTSGDVAGVTAIYK
jgi:hypothetical protein